MVNKFEKYYKETSEVIQSSAEKFSKDAKKTCQELPGKVAEAYSKVPEHIEAIQNSAFVAKVQTSVQYIVDKVVEEYQKVRTPGEDSCQEEVKKEDHCEGCCKEND